MQQLPLTIHSSEILVFSLSFLLFIIIYLPFTLFFFCATLTDCNGATTTHSLVDGIIGFAYNSLAVDPTESYYDQLVSTTTTPNIFALQMCQTTGTIIITEWL